VRWKDLRSGMACHLLRNGWTSDEVNARLGHAPNSAALNCYINFMALSRDDPKHRMWVRANQGRFTHTGHPTAVAREIVVVGRAENRLVL
jgi:hypothetical protein